MAQTQSGTRSPGTEMDASAPGIEARRMVLGCGYPVKSKTGFMFEFRMNIFAADGWHR